MLNINENDILKYLTVDACRAVMSDTLQSVSKGEIEQILRTAMHLSPINVFGIMPSYIKPKNVFGAKMISVFPENRKQGLPSHQGTITLFDATSGILLSQVDGEGITAVRTAAVSAVATEHLSRKDSRVLTIMGTGLQGRKHIESIMRIRPIDSVCLWDNNYDFAQSVAKDLSQRLDISVIAYENAEEAVKDADIICTVTINRQPVIERLWLKDGVHINAVGACTPDAREIDSATIKDAKLFVDFKESTINESGDYILALKEGVINDHHIVAEIGQVIAGTKSGRMNSTDITVFESLGLASEDIAAAYYVYEKKMEDINNEII